MMFNGRNVDESSTLSKLGFRRKMQKKVLTNSKNVEKRNLSRVYTLALCLT